MKFSLSVKFKKTSKPKEIVEAKDEKELEKIIQKKKLWRNNRDRMTIERECK